MRALYAQDLAGRKLLISFQTAAEVRYGALWRGWGQPKLGFMERHLATAVEVPPHAELTNEWAMLRNGVEWLAMRFRMGATPPICGLQRLPDCSTFR